MKKKGGRRREVGNKKRKKMSPLFTLLLDSRHYI
jgi:hypothetical protein